MVRQYKPPQNRCGGIFLCGSGKLDRRYNVVALRRNVVTGHFGLLLSVILQLDWRICTEKEKTVFILFWIPDQVGNDEREDFGCIWTN
ncbi:MAG: hypothetical protein WC553_03410 [Patescibacteria group bacterium]|jgi:hypothetical protein